MLNVRNVHFHNFSIAAIVAHQCRDFTAIGNRITADTMEGRTMTIYEFGPPVEVAYGIVVEGLELFGSGLINPEFVSGDVVIQDNYFNLQEDPFTTNPDWLTWSAVIAYTMEDVCIKGNHAYNNSGDALSCMNIQGDILFERNFVKLVSLAPVVGVPLYPFGINVGFFPDFWENSVQNIQVSKNEIVCPSMAFDQFAIAVWAGYDVDQAGAISIRQNKITLDMGCLGIWYAGMDDAYIGQNQIKGTGLYGIVLGADPPVIHTDNNVLLGNSVSAFEPFLGDIGLGLLADNNVIVGGSGILEDNGVDNIVKGGYWDVYTGEHVSMPGGIGDKISGALGAIHGP